MNRLPFDPYDFFGYIASGLVLVVGMEITLGFPQVLGKDLKAVEVVVLILAVYVAGQVLAGPAKAVLENLIVDKILKRPSINLFRARPPAMGRFLFPDFYRPLPPTIQNKILEKTNQGREQPEGEALFLDVRYDPIVLSDEKLMKKLDSFRDKYGFNRNLSFTLLVVGIALLTKFRVMNDPLALRYGVTALVVGILLFYRYLKFFRQYSFEMFNVYGGRK